MDDAARPAAAFAAQGRRPTMEDRHVVMVRSTRPVDCIAAVFDGHGGHEVADTAGREFLGLYRKTLGEATVTDELAARSLRSALAGIQELVAHHSSGATAAAVHVASGRIHAAVLGDSRVVAVGATGARSLIRDHRLSEPEERERVLAAGGLIAAPYFLLPDGNGLMTTRALGDREFERVGLSHEPEVAHCEAAGCRWVLAACDGVWDVIDVGELPELLSGASGAEEAAGRLGRVALQERGSTDNVTVVAISV